MKTKNLLIIFYMVLISLTFISAITIKNVSSNPPEIIPGEISTITIEIKNIFSFDVYNLNIRLDLSENSPFAPYQSSSEKFLDNLDDGDKEKFTFKLVTLPKTASGIYKIPVEISYEDEEGNKSTKQELISLIVNSEPELKIYLDDSVVLIKGKENVFSIKVVNSGLADVKFVYLSVQDSGGINFISEKEQYIGDIDSDDFDSIEFKTLIKDNALSNVNLPVTLKFKDATNKKFSETRNLKLKVYTLKEAQVLGLIKKPNYLPYFVVGFFIVFYIFYKIGKKKKRKEK